MRISNFKNKTALKKYMQMQLGSKLKVGEMVGIDHELWELMSELITQHYNYENLKRSGIDHFYVDTCKVNSRNKKFSVVRTDGSYVDFSIYKCISPKFTKERTVKAAFRKTIQPFVDAFKNESFKEADSKGYLVCPETGLKFKKKDAHVDHVYPVTFDSLFYKYCKDYNVDIDNVKIEENGWNNDNRPDLIDPDLRKSFYDWHSKQAKLRVVYWRANLQGKRTSNFDGNEDILKES